MATSNGNAVARWLRSRRNILGCLGALVGVVLAGVGLLPAPWWPLAVVALYAAGALAAPRGAPLTTELGDDRVDVERLRAAVARSRGRLGHQVPFEVTRAADRLVTALNDLFARPDLLRRGTPETFDIERLVDDYLPSAIEYYLSLPPAFANYQQLPNGGGLTARELLVSQLDVLETAVRDATNAASQDEANRLLAHGRFLADRFGPRNPDLDLSAPPPAAPPAPPNPLDLDGPTGRPMA